MLAALHAETLLPRRFPIGERGGAACPEGPGRSRPRMEPMPWDYAMNTVALAALAASTAAEMPLRPRASFISLTLTLTLTLTRPLTLTSCNHSRQMSRMSSPFALMSLRGCPSGCVASATPRALRAFHTAQVTPHKAEVQSTHTAVLTRTRTPNPEPEPKPEPRSPNLNPQPEPRT